MASVPANVADCMQLENTQVQDLKLSLGKYDWPRAFQQLFELFTKFEEKRQCLASGQV